jgi:uncharacterized protein (DUF983 family)
MTPERPLLGALLRGFRRRCPHCGEAPLFHRFLKVEAACGSCREALHHHRTDDAPPYFTVLIVGHIVIPLVLLAERLWSPSMTLQFAIWLPLSILLILTLLPRIKGALVGLQWACRMHGFGGPDPSEPQL